VISYTIRWIRVTQRNVETTVDEFVHCIDNITTRPQAGSVRWRVGRIVAYRYAPCASPARIVSRVSLERTVQYHRSSPSVIVAKLFAVAELYTAPVQSAVVDALNSYPVIVDGPVDSLQSNVSVNWFVVKLSIGPDRIELKEAGCM